MKLETIIQFVFYLAFAANNKVGNCHISISTQLCQAIELLAEKIKRDRTHSISRIEIPSHHYHLVQILKAHQLNNSMAWQSRLTVLVLILAFSQTCQVCTIENQPNFLHFLN